MWSKQKDSTFLRPSIQLKRPDLGTLQKAKNEPVYINKQSNDPPNITADISKAISKRLTNILCNKNVFDRNIDIYLTALKNSWFDGTITYNDQNEQANNVNIEEANSS